MEGDIINSLNNKIFLYPTDTVWGIGSCLYSKEACLMVHEIKGSSSQKPVSILFSNINMVLDYVSFPKEMTKDWLKTFFSMESTLGIPVSWLKKDIPSWITCDSPHLGIRCLDRPEISKIIDELGFPVTTTSLNKSGEPPITTYEEVLKFVKNSKFTFDIHKADLSSLSGNSSSIIFFNGDGKFEILRKGIQINQLEKHLEILTT